MHKLWFSFPDSRVASLTWTQVQFCSTSGSDKDGSPAGPVETKPTEKEQAAQSSAKTAGNDSALFCICSQAFELRLSVLLYAHFYKPFVS